MKLIMENWNKFVNREEANEKIKQIAANLEKYNSQMVNEEVEELNEVSGAAAALLVAFFGGAGSDIAGGGEGIVKLGGEKVELSQQDLERTANQIDAYAANVAGGGESIGDGASPEELVQTFKTFLSPHQWGSTHDGSEIYGPGLPTFASGQNISVGQVDDAVLGTWIAKADASGAASQAQAQDAPPGPQVQTITGGNVKLGAYHAAGKLAMAVASGDTGMIATAKAELEHYKSEYPTLVPGLQDVNFNTITPEDTEELLKVLSLDAEISQEAGGEPEPATGASGDAGPETEVPATQPNLMQRMQRLRGR